MLRKKQWTQEDPEDLFPTTYLTVHTFRNVEIKLTLRCIDEVLPIFVQLFDESVSFVQLRFVCLYFLPEAGAVQIAFTKLERVQSHFCDRVIASFLGTGENGQNYAYFEAKKNKQKNKQTIRYNKMTALCAGSFKSNRENIATWKKSGKKEQELALVSVATSDTGAWVTCSTVVK